MQIIKKILLGILMLSGTYSYADIEQELNKQFGSLVSFQDVGIWNTERRGIVSGGHVNARVPIKEVSIANISLPSVSAGCGGLDLYGGSLSYINKDEYVSLLKNVASNAKGYAFQIALSSMCEKCMQHMEALQQKIQQMNQYLGNSCQLAQGIVNDSLGAINRKGLNDVSLKANFLGIADTFELNSYTDSSNIYSQLDAFDANSSNNTEVDGGGNNSNYLTGNILWNLLYKSKLINKDYELAQNILGITGSIIVTKNGKELKKLPGNLLTLEQLIEGGKYYSYDCNKSLDCLEPKLVLLDIEGLANKIERLLNGRDNQKNITEDKDNKDTNTYNKGIITKLANNEGELTNEELSLISGLPSGYFVMIRNLAIRNEALARSFASDISSSLSVIYAYRLLKNYIKVVQDELLLSDNAYVPIMKEELMNISKQIRSDYDILIERYGTPLVIKQNYELSLEKLAYK